jgi:hypothetical protein
VMMTVPATASGPLSRTVSLLTLPRDDDVRKLWGSATAHPDKCDTELSRGEQQAYDRVVRRIDDLWSYLPARRRPTAFLTPPVQPRSGPRHLESSAVLRYRPRDHPSRHRGARSATAVGLPGG